MQHLRDNLYFTVFEYHGKPKRRYWVKTTCSFCGNEVFTDRNNFKKWGKAYCDFDCRNKSQTGPLNANWTGGRLFKQGTKIGYVLIYAPGHPYARKNYVPEHRLVVEKKLGRFLKPEELVHHIDCHKQHNSEDNLDVCSLAEHNQAHASLEKCVAELMSNGSLGYDREQKRYFVKTKSSTPL